MDNKYIETALADFKQGKMLIVCDDSDRENEGDFIAAAEKITPDIVNMMATYGKGLICTPITHKKAKQLDLDPMVLTPTDNHKTAFTVSIDHISNSTGISAYDRAETIKALAKNEAQATEFVRPGHVFPLIARKGGVLRRAGHTEAAIDLCYLSNMIPVSVICEIMAPDGKMANREHLERVAKELDIKIITIADLISYRLKQQSLIKKISKVNLPTRYGVFELHAFSEKNTDNVHVALTKGNWNENESVLTRVHSSCITGDVLGSLRCDCGDQLHEAMKKIEKEGQGVLLYMNQEGRGIGLANKLRAYMIQERDGLDTVEANEKLGFKPDMRNYGVGAQILRELGLKKLKLMTNNPQKRIGLDRFGLKITENIPLVVHPNPHNTTYLATKRDKLGHTILLSEE